MLIEHETYGLSKIAGHSYDCAMLHLPPEAAKKIIEFGESIPESDLRYGKPEDRETEPHITIGYGMEEPHLGRVANAFKDQQPIKAVLGRTSVFNKGDYDVVKVDIHSPELHEAHNKLKLHVPMPGDE